MTDCSHLTDNFQRIADAVNAQFSTTPYLDFQVISYQDETLKIKASSDIHHFHECEMVFSPVEYFNAPMRWRSRPAGGFMEVLPLSDELFFERGYGIAISFKTESTRKIIIAAAFIEFNFEKVAYRALQPASQITSDSTQGWHVSIKE